MTSPKQTLRVASLPEWPTEQAGSQYGAVLTLATARLAYWESRARLAVEALERYRFHYDGQGCLGANDTLRAIAPLPKEGT